MATPNAQSDRVRRWLVVVFFLSGLASLAYQVSWQRLLTLYYGVGSISTTVIVSVYMFGLGIGALVGGRLAERVSAKLLLYQVIELLIGLFGLASPLLLDLLGRHTAGSGHLLATLYAFAFFTIPTVLMGITLPLLVKLYNELVDDFLETVSYLYFINTLGAAAGTLITSYILISFFGLDIAVYVAVAINLGLAVLLGRARALLKQGSSTSAPPTPPELEAPVHEETGSLGRAAYALVLVTGFLAIGYEIVWFRIIGVMVKASPYAFSTVLAIYLLGIALGSYWMNGFLGRRPELNRRNLFFQLQFLLGATVLITTLAFYLLTSHTPFSRVVEASFLGVLHPPMTAPWEFPMPRALFVAFRFLDILLWPCVFVLIPSMVMGATFPLISVLALSDRKAEGQTIASVYFFTIAGNVLGGIVTGFLLLATLGTEWTLLLFIMVGLAFGVVSLGWRGQEFSVAKRVAIVTLTGALTLALWPGKGDLYAAIHQAPSSTVKTYIEEGVDCVNVTYDDGDSVHNYINGLGHGMRPGWGFHRRALETLAHAEKVDNVLIIGFGTGAIMEAAQHFEDIKEITLVELSDTLMNNLRHVDEIRAILDEPRSTLIIEDARQWLLQNQVAFDAILIDPLRSTTSFSNNLYSREFFELLKANLTPGGVLMMWMDEFDILPRTLATTFEHVKGYDDFCIAATGPMTLDTERRDRAIASYSPESRAKVIARPEAKSTREEILSRTAGLPINEDWRPACEYYLGRSFHKRAMQPSNRTLENAP